LLLVLCALLGVPQRSPAADLEPQVEARIASARAAVAENPGKAESWGELGMVLQAHGLQSEAYEIYLEAIARAPKDYRWPYLAALTDRPADAALELFAKAHSLGPADVALTLTYASALTRAGALDQARTVYLESGDGKTGNNESTWEHAQLGLARIALLEGQVEEALEILKVASRRAALQVSRNADLYRLLAQARQQVGDRAGAVEAAFKARSYSAGLRTVSDVVDQMLARGVSVSTLLDSGRRLSARGHHEEARAQFEAALRLGANTEALHDLGQVALAQGQARDAIEYFQTGLLEKPDSPELQVGLGLAWLQLGNDASAERALAIALELRPDDAAAHQALGRLRIRQQGYGDAIEHLERVLAREPTHYPINADLAAAFEKQGSIHEALEARSQLAILAPDQLPNLRSLARLEIELANLRAAQATLRRIHQQQPDDFSVAFNLAMLLATSVPVSEPAAAESLDLAQQLYRTHRHDAACADLLSIAYAANGRFGDATRSALRAQELARADAALSAAIDDHLTRYAQEQLVTAPLLR
jgi:tetratricopeptide (TPR) repeat protein